jgi:predicted flap endonuclease-1-like 5' DNA nuclease
LPFCPSSFFSSIKKQYPIMIQKEKLIQKIVKVAKISEAKARAAYETVLLESGSWRKQEMVSVSAKVEKAVKVPGKQTIKRVELVKEVPVKTVQTIEKIKTIEVIKEVPVEVIKIVEKIKEIKVVKEVPIEVVKEVIKEVQVIKEVPIEVIKEVTLIKEVEVEKIKEVKVPVEVIREIKVPVVKEVKVPVVKEVKVQVIKEVKIKDEKLIAKSKEQAAELSDLHRQYNDLYKLAVGYEKDIAQMTTALKAKPKEVIKKVEVIKEVKVPVVKEVKVIKEVKVPVVKEVKVPVVKEVKVEVIKEVKVPVVKEVKVEVIKEVKVKDEKQIKALQSEIATLKAKLKEKPKQVIKEVPVEIIREVEVTKGVDMTMLKSMLAKMQSKEVSKTVIGETRTEKEAVLIQKREVKAGTNKADDLTKIEGIGPKISQLLGRKGIYTFEDLSNLKSSYIQDILDAAGPKYTVHSPSTWPQQAKLAAAGKWDDLKTLQDKLQGGKKVN